jgi:3-deoxy-D-arabino-heptulosonate 7-phosphate (DAHP) synthase
LKLMKPRSLSEFINRALGIGRRDQEYESAREELEKELDIIEVIKKMRKIEIAVKFILKSHHIRFLPVIGPCVVTK